jgi:hypothetical protein
VSVKYCQCCAEPAIDGNTLISCALCGQLSCTDYCIDDEVEDAECVECREAA